MPVLKLGPARQHELSRSLLHDTVLPDFARKLLELIFQPLLQLRDLSHNLVVVLVFARHGCQLVRICPYLSEPHGYAELCILPSEFVYMLCTCLIFLIKSGAERSKPAIMRELKPSAVLAMLARPLLSFSNDYGARPVNYRLMDRRLSLITLSTLRKSLTLQLFAWMRATIRSRSGSPLATSAKSASKAGLSNKSWTASKLERISIKNTPTLNIATGY
jgi:hypothetical protein